MNPLKMLQEHGQSVWLDFIQRSILDSGELQKMIVDDGLAGVTSNPSIFEKAIAGSQDYDASLQKLVEAAPSASPQSLFFSLAVEDIRKAADQFRPVYETSRMRDGYVSLEVSPDLAYDTDATVTEARALFERVDRPNLMIKVPATKPGLAAIEQLISEGINVNATLLFSVERYREVAQAFIKGLEKRKAQGQPVEGIASVASFFVSRVDSKLDKQLASRVSAGGEMAGQAQEMMGRLAIANAKMAYELYGELFHSGRFDDLQQAGAQTQRVLWASTGTKNPQYSDVLYVDMLIGADTVNTLPPATMNAFRDHGKPEPTLMEGLDEARDMIAKLDDMGIDLQAVTDQLEEEGVKLFADAFNNLMAVIDDKAGAFRDGQQGQG